MNELAGKRVLTFVGDIYEELELWYPKYRLEEAGVNVVMAGVKKETYSGKHKYPAEADVAVTDVREADFDGLYIAGGFMPDKLRRDKHVLALTQAFSKSNKLIGMICHAGWIPISAGILKGRKVTGTLAIKDDLENAGATFVDEPLVVDGNLISSRKPADLPLFGAALVDFLSKKI